MDDGIAETSCVLEGEMNKWGPLQSEGQVDQEGWIDMCTVRQDLKETGPCPGSGSKQDDHHFKVENY